MIRKSCYAIMYTARVPATHLHIGRALVRKSLAPRTSSPEKPIADEVEGNDQPAPAHSPP